MLNEYQKHLESIADSELEAYFFGTDSFISKDGNTHIIYPESTKMTKKLTVE